MKKASATHLIRLESSNRASCDCDLDLMQLAANQHSKLSIIPSFRVLWDATVYEPWKKWVQILAAALSARAR